MAQARGFQWTHINSFAASEGGYTLRQQLFIVAIVLLFITLALMGTALSHLRDSLRESEAAEGTMLELTTIETRLADFDGDLRGYALTGDGWFQKDMDWNRNEIRLAMGSLRLSLQSDPEQLKEYREIARLIRLRDGLTAYLRKPEHRGEVWGSPAGKSELQSTNRIRGKLWDILITQRAKRYANHAEMIAEATKSFWLAFGIVVIATLAGLCFFAPRPQSTPTRVVSANRSAT